MSQSSNSGHLASIEELEVVVDADGHISESVNDILPYMKDEYRPLREQIERARVMHQEIYTRAQPSPRLYEQYGDNASFAREQDYDPQLKLGEMGDFGIDYSLLNPGANLAINTVNNKRYAVALANAYNSYVLDTIEDQDSLKAYMIVAPKIPDKAAEEIYDRADEADIVGIGMSPTALHPPAGDMVYEPIFEAAERHDLPIVFHSASGAPTALPTMFTWNQTYPENHVLTHPIQHMWTLTSLLFNGIPARYPGLRFIFQEAGVGYIPYMKWRIDDHFLEHQEYAPALERLPSEYIDEQFYFTTQPLGHTAENPQHLAQVIDMAGPDNIMYSADLPHPDFDTPEELFNRICRYFDADTVRGIMGETAAELFALR